MALGSNLKRAKKDSLIPKKKKTEGKKTEDKTVKQAKVQPVVKKEKVIKTKSSPAAAAKPKKAATKEKETAPKQPRQTANLEERVLAGGQEGAPITAKLYPSRRKSVRKCKLVLNGSLTLQEAEPLKEVLMATFNDFDLIDIKLEEVTQLDLIPIQMIKAFINSYPDKTIKVDSDLPFDIKLIVERAGFGPLMFKEEAA